ncbi:hypothetical protein [Streptomyces sp. NPDC050564]|uniref:hypothetical protein n=1 Tax=Streptomyces sp. NPDC050564 TaxID=3365631 RepID=UPI0037BC22CA
MTSGLVGHLPTAPSTIDRRLSGTVVSARADHRLRCGQRAWEYMYALAGLREGFDRGCGRAADP